MNVKDELMGLILRIVSNEKKIQIVDSTLLTKDLGFSSVQLVQLVVEIEHMFKIELLDSELDLDIITVFGRLYSLVLEKVKNRL